MKRHLDDILYERPGELKVFVSSQMRGGVLLNERGVADGAIKKTGYATSWLWENDACAGPYSSEAICLGHARTSDGLVLILAQQLTRITQKEYEEADLAGAWCYVFLKQGVKRQRKAGRFISRVRKEGTTVNFKNLSELESQITAALKKSVVDSYRIPIMQRRNAKRSSINPVLESIKSALRSLNL